VDAGAAIVPFRPVPRAIHARVGQGAADIARWKQVIETGKITAE